MKRPLDEIVNCLPEGYYTWRLRDRSGFKVTYKLRDSDTMENVIERLADALRSFPTLCEVRFEGVGEVIYSTAWEEFEEGGDCWVDFFEEAMYEVLRMRRLKSRMDELSAETTDDLASRLVALGGLIGIVHGRSTTAKKLEQIGVALELQHGSKGAQSVGEDLLAIAEEYIFNTQDILLKALGGTTPAAPRETPPSPSNTVPDVNGWLIDLVRNHGYNAYQIDLIESSTTFSTVAGGVIGFEGNGYAIPNPEALLYDAYIELAPGALKQGYYIMIGYKLDGPFYASGEKDDFLRQQTRVVEQRTFEFAVTLKPGLVLDEGMGGQEE